MKRYMLFLLLPIPVFASDFSPLMHLLIAASFILAILVFVIIFLLTKRMHNKMLKQLLRILPLSIMLTPIYSDSADSYWPSAIYLMLGDIREMSMVLASITLATAMLFILVRIIESARH